MMTRLFVMIFSIMYLLTCSSIASATTSHKKKHTYEEEENYSPESNTLPYFTAIKVGANIHLFIMNSKTGAQRIAPTNVPVDLQIDVENRTLVLNRLPDRRTNPPTYLPNIINVTVWTPNLRLLQATDEAKVTMEDVGTPCGLTVIAQDKSKVTLRGNIKLDKLLTSGSSNVNIQWVDSYHVKIRSIEDSCVTLAGCACKLDACLTQCGKLDAKFLRTQEVYIKTCDFSCADVLPIAALNAFASNFSSVNYYKEPLFITRDSTESATVLQMACWN